VSSDVTTQSLDAVVASDASLVRILVNGTLAPADLDATTLSSTRAAALEAELAVVASRGSILRIDVRTPAGALLFASDSLARATTSSPDFVRAATGSTGRASDRPPIRSSAPLRSSRIAPGHSGEPFARPDGDAATPTPSRSIAASRRDRAPHTDGIAGRGVDPVPDLPSAHRRLRRQAVASVEATRQPLTGC